MTTKRNRKNFLYSNKVPCKARRPTLNIHRLYDQVAEKWARDEPKVHDDFIGRPIVVQLTKQLGRNGVILDCGCGDGNICRLVSPFAKKVIGIDFSSKMLAEAKKRSYSFRNITYIKGDIRNIGKILRPSTVDVCLALYAVCCIKDKKQLLQVFKQTFTVLKRGHFAIIQIPHPLDGLFREPSRWFRDIDPVQNYFAGGRLIRRKLRTVDGDWLLVARYHYSLYDYFWAIRSAGFLVERILEPQPSADALRNYPSLSRENRLPSSLIFIARRPKHG